MDIVVELALKPTLLADTTVIHPVARLSASAKSSGAAAKIREQQKTKAYEDSASRSLQMQLTPLAVTMMLPMHLVAIRKSTTTTNQNRESTKKKKKWLLSDFFKAEMNVEI